MKQMIESKLPVFSSSDGRTVIGYAAGERSAGTLIRRTVNVPTGFKLAVWKRSDSMGDMLKLPIGFCYSIYR